MARFDISIQARPEKVFHVITDPELFKQWLKGSVEIIPVSGQMHEVGATFKQLNHQGGKIVEYDGKVKAFERDRKVAVEVWDKNFRVDVSYELEIAGDSTRIHYAMDFTGKTISGKAMAFMLNSMAPMLCKKQMTELKRFVEASSGVGHA